MAGSAKIREILDHPDEYKDKEVILDVEHLGWGASDCNLQKTSMRTRSDVLLKDETGCIFSDPVPGISPYEKKKVRIKGIVELYAGKPRLKEISLAENQ